VKEKSERHVFWGGGERGSFSQQVPRFRSRHHIRIKSVPHRETHYVSATKPNRLMLFREIIAVYCENHTEHINTLCGQNAEFLSVQKQVVYI
jgi:hypothetical protein